MLKRSAIVILSAAVLAGCASTATVKLSHEQYRAMQSKTLVVTTSERPDFAAMTAGKAMFGLVGAVAMVSEGNEIIRTHDVQDPAQRIAAKLADELGAARAMNVANPIEASKAHSIEALAAIRPEGDYVLDVRTINWGFGYYPTDWDNYRVVYSVKTRLIDTQQQKVVAEAFCSRVPDQAPDSPSYEELLNSNAARLKRELHLAADHCSAELLQKLM